MKAPATKKTTVTKKAPGQLGKFFRDLKAELRKVTWPTWKETRVYSLVVIGTVLFFMIIFLIFDTVMLKTFFQWLVQ